VLLESERLREQAYSALDFYSLTCDFGDLFNQRK
jgi:hypothetical protein